MEADEIEISKVELQNLISDRVQKTLLSSSALNDKLNVLQSLLSRKQRQINKLSTICQSVAKCEKTVKELYSLLGWEYEDQDSDQGDAEPAVCSRVRPFLFVPSGHHIHKAQPPSPQSSESEDEEVPERPDDCESPVILKKTAVVVLTKLRRSQIPALRSPSPQPDSSEEDVLNSPESDMQWEPETDPSDSDFSGSDFDARPHKRRRMDQTDRMCTRTSRTPRGGRYVDSNSGSLTPTSTPGTSSSAESDGLELSPREATPDAVANGSPAEATADTTETESEQGQTTEPEQRKRTELEKRKRTEPENQKTTEPEQRNRTESEQIKTMESEQIKTTEPEQRNRTEPEKRKRTEPEQIKTTEPEQIKTTEPEKRKATDPEKQKRTEPKKRKTTEPEKRKATESDKRKTIGSNTSKKTPQAKTTTPQTNTTNSTPQSNTNKTTTPSAEINGGTPVTSQSQTPTSTPKVLQVELTVNLNVLARRRTLSWKPGKITEIITKGDGKVKYKVVFEEQGKCLVSSHHMALNCLPQLEYLVIGARVVVRCEGDQSDYKPGILAEVPSRKNRMRFLVFIDDHTPVYCALPLLHLVCKPLADPLDDIPDENHRNYMREYLKAWPYPMVTQYKLGQMLNVEYNGVQQKVEVVVIDCSLIQVVFTCDQHKEWIFRGSMRLEHMVNVRKDMLAKMNGEKKN